MSPTTTPTLGLTYLTSGQLQPEVTINNDLNILDNAVASAAAFSNNPLTTTGLTYGYLGGNIYTNGADVAIAAGTVALTASATNYIQRTAQGGVSVNTTGFTTGLIPMATVATSASTITTITDNRPSAYSPQGRQVVNVGAPTGTSVSTATTGGTLAAATYGYRVSAVYPWGESAASLEMTVATTGTTSENTIHWTLPAQATAAKIYGRTSGAELLITTVLAGTTSYVDTGSVTPSGALPTGTITLPDAQVNAQILSLQGALSANTVLDFPLYTQQWMLSNETSGAYTLSAQTTNGLPIMLTQGAATSVYGNGTILKSGNPQYLQESDVFSDFIVSGIIGAVPSSSLSMTIPAGVAYALGNRVTPAAYAFTYAASSDSYVDLSNTGTYTVTAVANGAAAPAVAANSLRTQNVVTSATAVTGVTQIASSNPGLNTPPPQFSYGNQVATMGSVQRALGGFSGFTYQSITGSGTGVAQVFFGNSTTPLVTYPIVGLTAQLDASAYGTECQLSPAVANTTTYLPQTDFEGSGIFFKNDSSTAQIVAVSQANGFIYAPIAGLGTTNTSITLSPGDSVFLMNRGRNEWDMIHGTWMSRIFAASAALSTAVTTTAGALTVGAGALVAGYIIDSSTQTAAAVITTDTAANLLAARYPAMVGTSFTFRLINNDQSATGYPISLAAGTGVTIGTALPNPSIPKGGWSDFLFTFTNVTPGSAAVTVTPVGGVSAGLL
ncbi:MAG: hypothetical protein ACYC0M_15335 [Burkholderiales bacterium]